MTKPGIAPELYTELRRLAVQLMRRERPAHTLQPTALAHEAYIRMGDGVSRTKFLGRAAKTMRRVLVDHARKRAAQKRGGGAAPETLHDQAGVGAPSGDLVALDEALTRLEETAPRQAHVVELLFFAGLSVRECAEALALSMTTVEEDWYLARAWLKSRLG